ncbi:PLD nuclease N-terminal domain-containing protein [Paenibacillus sp. SN-8-1]|uniref:PLD nuclease N-terminal domain-containing protein n=1 Tax=Paenibacillus sp. SN-8-1 TaxID=3435409 RepID=UPI003D9A3E5A
MTEALSKLFGISLEQAQVVLPLLIVHAVLALIALIDLIKNWKNRTIQPIWLILIVVISFIGPLLYFVVGRKMRNGNKFS